jgi:geranylgeranyl diphosphate synthase type I
MDVYASTVEYLSNLPVLKEWKVTWSILEKLTVQRPRDWQLPLLACEAVGGSGELAVPVVSALACVQIGIVLIDDMLDKDPRGEYRRTGEGQAANIAAAFLSAGAQAILQSDARPRTRLEAFRTLNRMVLVTSFGQFLDSLNPSDELDYWRVVENKSATFYGAALRLGAVFGNAPDKMAENVEMLGHIYGEMIQIHDDLNDTLTVPASPDWVQGRSPLPILFAKGVDHPERTRFLKLCQEIGDENALREAQDILVRCGAVSYCVDQLLRRYQSARQALGMAQFAHSESIESLLEEVIAPVRKLFDAMGVAVPRLAIP